MMEESKLNWVNYNHLLYFKVVVDQGSIAKASKILRVGAPAISMQIKHLEDYLQMDLFLRKNRNLILTDTGKIVYEYSREIFDLGSQMMTTIKDRANGRIKIHIGVQDSVSKNLVSRITSYIYQEFDAMVSVYNGTLLQMVQGVSQHQYDVVVLNYPPSIEGESVLLSKRILRCPIVIAGSDRFLHLKGRPINEFNRLPFILPSPSNGLRHRFEHHCSSLGLEYHLAGESTDTVIHKNMAISGNGLIPIMKDAILSYVKNKQLHILYEFSDLSDELWLVSGKRQIENPIASKLMKHFKF